MPEPFSFETLLQELNTISEWLSARGYRTHDRIRKYRKNVRRLLELEREDSSFAIRAKMSDAQIREMLWTVVEADEFVRAVVPLRLVLGDEMAGAPIQKALSGPSDLLLETPESSHGRNFMFELIMGGRLAKAGIIPGFDRGPDVSFELPGLRVAMQCKRPFSPEGVKEVIRKAISQLRTEDADLRLIAVSVSRLLNPGEPDVVPIVSGPLAGQNLLEAQGRLIADLSRTYWKEKLERSGILFYGFAPVRWMKRDGRYGYASLRAETLCPVVDSDTSTKARLRQYCDAVGR